MDDFNKKDREEVYSVPVRAGQRTYFFDVKATKTDEYFITITESKKRFNEDGTFFFQRHKVFVYKEDFEKFAEGMNDVMDYVKEKQGPIISAPRFENNNGGNNNGNISGDGGNSDGAGNFSDVNFDDLGK